VNEDEVFLQHLVTCQEADVHVTTGITKVLLHCRTCHAEVMVPKDQVQ